MVPSRYNEFHDTSDQQVRQLQQVEMFVRVVM